MNERIRELAEQAGINCVVPTIGTLEYSGKGEVEHLKKFAELIVRDCLYIVEPMQDNNHEWCVTLKATAKAIKEHFGVEG